METGVLCMATACEEKESVRRVSPALGLNPTHPGMEAQGQGKLRQQCLRLAVAYKGHRDERPEPMQPPKVKVGKGRATTRAPGSLAQSRKERTEWPPGTAHGFWEQEDSDEDTEVPRSSSHTPNPPPVDPCQIQGQSPSPHDMGTAQWGVLAPHTLEDGPLLSG